LGLHDVWAVGHVTRDRIRTPSGTEERAGGTATYFPLALARLGGDVGVLTRIAREDEAELLAEHRAAEVEVVCAPSAKTTEFENRYVEDDPDHRVQRVGAVALPFVPEDLASIRGRVIHLGPLTYEDMSCEFIAAAAEVAPVSLDAQGLVRRIVRGGVELCDWPEKREGLARVKVLKANEDEARVLAGEEDLEAAARVLASWGPDDVLVTCASKGSILYTGGALHHVPAYEVAGPIDPTGCGDTFMAGYLAERVRGSGPCEAARFASAAVALKLGGAGPFAGTRQRVAKFVSERSG
jgi:sugar/nucleoside kinase (ribokinase family)